MSNDKTNGKGGGNRGIKPLGKDLQLIKKGKSATASVEGAIKMKPPKGTSTSETKETKSKDK